MTAQLSDIDSRADARISQLGALLGDQLPGLSAALHEHLAGAIEPLQGDGVLLDLLYDSIEGNLETLARILRFELSVYDALPPVDAVEYARRLAQRGISSTALIRAYRLGQQLIVDWGLQRLAEFEPDRDAALLAGQKFTALSFSYIDSISEGIVAEYESERERWVAHRNTVRADMIEQVVAGQSPSIDVAEQALGYRLRQHHVAVALWAPTSTDTPQTPLEPYLQSIAEQLGASSPLFHSHDRSQAWGWVPLGTTPQPHPSIDQLLLDNDHGVRAAIGTAAPGLEGFRASHLEAQRARRVAVIAGDAAPAVTSYGDAEVRTAALLGADLDTTRRMVRRALGGLAADTAPAARLRETLLAFLSEKSSYLATAERVHLHKNTVKYRIERAIEERGRPIDEDRLELELALVACHRLGDAVLLTSG